MFFLKQQAVLPVPRGYRHPAALTPAARAKYADALKSIASERQEVLREIRNIKRQFRWIGRSFSGFFESVDTIDAEIRRRKRNHERAHLEHRLRVLESNATMTLRSLGEDWTLLDKLLIAHDRAIKATFDELHARGRIVCGGNIFYPPQDEKVRAVVYALGEYWLVCVRRGGEPWMTTSPAQMTRGELMAIERYQRGDSRLVTG